MNLPHNRTFTSMAAAEEARDKEPTQAEQVLQWLREHYGGATSHEIAEGTGLTLQTVTARVNGLNQQGRIRHTEETRETPSGKQAKVYEFVTFKIQPREIRRRNEIARAIDHLTKARDLLGSDLSGISSLMLDDVIHESHESYERLMGGA